MFKPYHFHQINKKIAIGNKFISRNITSKSANEINFAQKYVSNIVEKHKYEKWIEDKPINSKSSGKIFTMLLPPPNITGTLHLGHALTLTIQDVLVRLNRMKGYQTLWIPGMDHAGIATQVIVEKKLWNEKKVTRHEIGRCKFIEEVFKWKSEKESVIRDQMIKLGAILNWEHEFFTLDEKRVDAVQEAFIKLFEMGLIYRENKLVNWCCALQSAISDIEVDYLDISKRTRISVPNYDSPVEFGTLTNFSYKIIDNDEEISVSTTRPETILGDTALAIHPQDPRYYKFHNKFVWHPFRNEAIPIINDPFVDRNFGTGVVKITPAHDPVDFEVGRRHKLKVLEVINEQGVMTFKDFEGLKRFEARKLITEKLAEMGLLKGIEDHSMKVPICSRSKDVIEYIIKPQWFLNCKKMAEEAINDVKNGQLRIEPKTFEKTWLNWLEKIHDWCISRQLWWGHKIPAYKCQKGDRQVWVAAKNETEALQKASILFGASKDFSKNKDGDIMVKQDSDVLDTWFSSSILPFSSIDWPEKTPNFEKYYPLTLMETGHDILFFWVARMVMMGKIFTGKLPFDKILLHGIICDSTGRKMSKSRGNVVFPENVINGITLSELNVQLKNSFNGGLLSKDEYERALSGQKKMFPNGIPKCGADSLRFTLLSHNIKSHFINFDLQECHTNALFCNKIWQACKFVHVYKTKINPNLEKYEPSYVDKWILSRLSSMIFEINSSLEKFDFHIATLALKKFLYNDFCDIYLESVKPELKNGGNEAPNHMRTLIFCLEQSLRCLSPFMPFIADELYKFLPQHPGVQKVPNLLEGPFPSNLNLRNESLEQEIELILDVVSTVRRLRKLVNIGAKDSSKTYILSDLKLFSYQLNLIKTLSGCTEIFVSSNFNKLDNVLTLSDTIGKFGLVKIEIPKSKMEGVTKERARMSKKVEKLSEKISKLKNTVLQDSFKTNAPIEVQKVKFEQLKAMEKELVQLQELHRSYNF